LRVDSPSIVEAEKWVDGSTVAVFWVGVAAV
jgi:hypothetical protein